MSIGASSVDVAVIDQLSLEIALQRPEGTSSDYVSRGSVSREKYPGLGAAVPGRGLIQISIFGLEMTVLSAVQRTGVQRRLPD